MYTSYINSHFTRLAVFLAIITYCNITTASTTIVSYDFEDATGLFENAAEISTNEVDAQPWFDTQSSLTSFSGNPGKAIAARTFLDGNALILVVNILTGFSIDLDGYSFDHQASASGPTDWDLRIDGVGISSGTTTASFTGVSGALSLDDLTDPIIVELFGFGASSNSGTYRLDNFALTGSVTPIPLAPAIVLFGSGLAFLTTRLRR